MKNVASNDDRVKLSQILGVKVNSMLKQYTCTTGNGDNETVDEAINDVSKSISSQTLVGSKIIKSRVSPNGDLYVFMGIDNTTATSQAIDPVKSSMNNDNALWQQFKAKNGHIELEQAVASLVSRQTV